MLDSIRRWFKYEAGLDHVTVEKGDSLWTITKDITGDGQRWRELADANPSHGWTQDHIVRPGDKLKLPDSWL